MERQLPWLRSARLALLSRKVTVLTAAGALCLAVTGVLIAFSWSAPASSVQAADVLYVHPTAPARAPGKEQRPTQASSARQTILIDAALRAAAARTATARAAARAAAVRAAERRAAREAERRAAAAQAAAAQQAAAQAAAQQAAMDAAAEQAQAGTPQEIAEQMLPQYGWSGQFSCLDALWANESGWDTYAQNPSSGAYGIPQALPGSKMAAAGPDWESDPVTQIRWGLSYIQASYGSPCAAWDHEEAAGWY